MFLLTPVCSYTTCSSPLLLLQEATPEAISPSEIPDLVPVLIIASVPRVSSEWASVSAQPLQNSIFNQPHLPPAQPLGSVCPGWRHAAALQSLLTNTSICKDPSVSPHIFPSQDPTGVMSCRPTQLSEHWVGSQSSSPILGVEGACPELSMDMGSAQYLHDPWAALKFPDLFPYGVIQSNKGRKASPCWLVVNLMGSLLGPLADWPIGLSVTGASGVGYLGFWFIG